MSTYIGAMVTIKEELLGGKITVSFNSKDGTINIREDDDPCISLVYREAELLIKVLQMAVNLHGSIT